MNKVSTIRTVMLLLSGIAVFLLVLVAKILLIHLI